MEYPIQYIEPLLLKDGSIVQLRPIHPMDGAQALPFREKLSDESLRDRFLGYIPSITKSLVDKLTKIDYEKEMAIVAEIVQDGKKEPIAVARIAPEPNTNTAEFAIIIVDEWQGKGLGGKMTDYMIMVARDLGFEKLYALLFSHNVMMHEIFRNKGFKIRNEEVDTDRAELDLVKTDDKPSI